MGKAFPKFSDRLKYLMKINGYKSTKELATAIYHSGLRGTDDNKNKSEKESIENIKRAIENHLHREYASGVYNDWIDSYVRFFHCSADFLFGYIDMPTHELTDAAAYTGLEERTVDYLHKNRNSSGYGLLSELLCRDDFFKLLFDVEQVALWAPSIFKDKGITNIIPDKDKDFSFFRALGNDRYLAAAFNRGTIHEAAFSFESILREITDMIMRL